MSLICLFNKLMRLSLQSCSIRGRIFADGDMGMVNWCHISPQRFLSHVLLLVLNRVSLCRSSARSR